MSHESNRPHEVNVIVQDPKLLEAVGPQFLRESLLKAQHQTRMIVLEVLSQIQVGMTEDEARILALDIFADHGIQKHWHRPYIRFGPGTILSFHDPVQPDYKLQENDILYIDMGPVIRDEALGVEYEGDYGDSYILGENKEANVCIQSARKLFLEARSKWLLEHYTGEQMYEFLKSRAESLGYKLHQKVLGHRVSDFPHHKFTKEKLGALKFKPSQSIWVLEVHLLDSRNRFGAFFEDLL